ncbi:hypothetical protein SDC9_204613 [bioreactor metagenome]|uniref:Uncharacterized protein n=1 Tax=bioreactor metagenome TaxID=1076179 RepID=A0A645J177_9ZZZZ
MIERLNDARRERRILAERGVAVLADGDDLVFGLALISENITIDFFELIELNGDVFIVIVGQNYFEFCHVKFVPPKLLVMIE